MEKLMAWYAYGEDEKILHIRNAQGYWEPFNVSRLQVPEYLIPGGSKGYATMQHLFKQGYKLVSAEQVEADLRRESDAAA